MLKQKELPYKYLLAQKIKLTIVAQSLSSSAFNCNVVVFEFYLREQLHGICMCGPVPRPV